MKATEFIVAEEKVRLDPKCWTGKKIGNPKTKMKGGVRVNNCVPAESVAEGTEDYYRQQSDQAWKNVAAKDKGPIGRFATKLAAKMDGSNLFGNKVYYVSSENGETAAGSKEEAQALVAKLKKAGILASVKVRKVNEGVAEGK